MKRENNQPLNKIIDSFLTIRDCKIPQKHIDVFLKCEKYRNKLLKDNSMISFNIFGSDLRLSVKNICKKASSKPIWAQLIFLILNKMSSPKVLEMGTNLGVSGTYILYSLKGKKNSSFITMEGVEGLCKIAKDQFLTINSKTQHQIIQGLYQHTFSQIRNPIL